MKIKKIVAVLATMGMAMSTAMITHTTVNAANTVVGGSFKFETFLIQDTGAVVPTENISYTVTPYGDNKTDSTYTTITKPVSAFTSSMQPSATALAKDTEVTSAGGNDSVTLANGQSYARAAATVDLSSVTYKNIGTYQYIITQDKGTDTSITYDTQAAILEVTVQYQETSATDKTLKLDDSKQAIPVIVSYIMYKADYNAKTQTYTKASSETKIDGFTDTRETENLTIASDVSGNEASHNEYFGYTVTITNTDAKSASYNVSLTNAEASVAANAVSTAHTNAATISDTDGDGTIRETFWLKKGQSVVIQGLKQGTTYSIAEDKTTLDNEKYSTVTAEITGDQSNDANGFLLTSGTYSSDANNSLILGSTKAASTLKIAGAATDGSWSQAGNSIVFVPSSDATTKVTYTISADGKTLTYDSANSTTALKVPTTLTSTDAVQSNATTITSNTTNYLVEDTYLASDTTVKFTNTKTGVIPTGVILNTAPYVAIVLAGFFGIILFVKKKREETLEED